MTVLNCHACASLPCADRGVFGWERVRKIVGGGRS